MVTFALLINGFLKDTDCDLCINFWLSIVDHIIKQYNLRKVNFICIYAQMSMLWMGNAYSYTHTHILFKSLTDTKYPYIFTSAKFHCHQCWEEVGFYTLKTSISQSVTGLLLLLLLYFVYLYSPGRYFVILWQLAYFWKNP